MLDELSSTQISEWQAYDRLDPIGTWREDFRMAYLSMIITNLVRAIHGKEETKIAIPLDFMPDWGKGEEEVKETGQTQEDMKKIMMAVARVSKKRKPHKMKQKQVTMKNRKP